jgi:hypothetical protein
MKNVAIIFLIGALMILSIGCFMIPPKPSEALAPEGWEKAAPAPQPATQAPKTPAAAEDVIEQVAKAETKYTPAEPEPVNTTNETATPELKISDSLKLQSSTDLCPHLAEKFDCNRYDIRSCKFKTLVGQNDFYPDLMSCRSGYEYRKEDPRHKYCYIQECRPLEKNNIVEAYGGPVMYAEYIYSEEQTAAGIMTHYTLLKCGEVWQESKTSADCKFYLSKLNAI